ncbi:MAG TPA: RHS repeat-associated core domain-containing protein [Flavisolibacter sp.]|nr:RHS repeat-associated core domain-containing protein [Flavisolibacter sp.]
MASPTGGSRKGATEQNFDAWGRNRNPSTWQYSNVSTVPSWLYRGYTGHEHLKQFVLINMNGRMYDPVQGRMLSPDNYVSTPFGTQGYNRYTYALNNPLAYVDPDGNNPLLVAAIITAAIGAHSGGMIANNGEFNPFKWDWSSGRTWTYMVGGAVVGAASGYLGGIVAASGMPFANTAGIISSSFVNSFGMNIVTGGKVSVSVSFGFGSYDFGSGAFNYLGKKGNSFLQNVGYGLGAIANFNDLMVGFKPKHIGKVDLVTEHSDAIGHSALIEPGSVNNNMSIVSFGPPDMDFSLNPFKSVRGTNDWPNHSADNSPIWRTTISGVNKSKILRYGVSLSEKTPRYNVYYSSCVTHTSIALLKSGFFNIGVHPFILHGQAFLRSVGLRTYLSHYLQNSGQ